MAPSGLPYAKGPLREEGIEVSEGCGEREASGVGIFLFSESCGDWQALDSKNINRVSQILG